MGFSTIIDILGSIVVGGFLMLILFRINDAAVDNVYSNGEEVILQGNLATTAMVLEHDFRKIGYCKNWNKIPDPSKAILLADSTGIAFLTDDDNDGNVDTMHYYVGPPSELTSTPNPRDRFLYRVINSQTPIGINLGITHFKLNYFDPLGDTITLPIADPGNIATMEINLTVENVYGYGTDDASQYSQAFWRQIRLAARNLQNR